MKMKKDDDEKEIKPAQATPLELPAGAKRKSQGCAVNDKMLPSNIVANRLAQPVFHR